MDIQQARNGWALVTGASAGIGREFAMQLGAAKINLILVARRINMLENLAHEIEAKYHVRVLTIAADLTHAESLKRVKQFMTERGIKIRVLINNAGMAPLGHFEQHSIQKYMDTIRLNVFAPVILASLFLDDLLSFPTSAMINVSSTAALNPVPYMAVYGASKAFISNFSQALFGEFESRGLTVQTLLPGPTKTDLGQEAVDFAPYFKHLLQTPQQVVSKSLAELRKNTPFVLFGKGTLNQRFWFSFIFTRKIILRIVAKMFKPHV